MRKRKTHSAWAWALRGGRYEQPEAPTDDDDREAIRELLRELRSETAADVDQADD